MFNLETHDELKDFLKNWVVLYVTDIGITSSVLRQLTDEVAYSIEVMLVCKVKEVMLVS